MKCAWQKVRGIVLGAATLMMLCGVLPWIAPGAFAQTPAKKAAGKAPGKAGTEQKYKAIFEPVNYSEDLRLLDAHFASADEGWVSGQAGTILHTNDAGKTWTAQLGGDPQSKDREIIELRFVDQTHGWAMQNMGSQSPQKLLRTTDGESWETIGMMPNYYDSNVADYAFASATTGAYVVAGKIFQTTDGGKKWTEVLKDCEATAEVEGLKRKVSCTFYGVHFPSNNVGYALGASRDVEDQMFVAKTLNGGATWTVHLTPGPDVVDDLGSADIEVLFTDDNTGIISVAYGHKIYLTSDGGDTWRGVVGTGGPRLKFADANAGWTFERSDLSYSIDGGKRWLQRRVPFPAMPRGFHLPQSDRGYVVGDHGMIFKYHIVPVEYSVKGMIGAPMMPVSKAEPAGGDKSGAAGTARAEETPTAPPPSAAGSSGKGTTPTAGTKPTAGTGAGKGTAPATSSSDMKPAEGATAGAVRGKTASGTAGGGSSVPLRSHGKAQEILQGLVNGWREKEINVALLGGQNYMVNDCLGVHPSAGEFTLKVASPNFRIEGSEIVLTFRIARVSLNALKVRVRPNPTNLSDPCTFGGAIEMGGSASDLTYEMRFDPLLNVQQCKLASVGQVRQSWRIGGLNLKPLQNDLDRVAKNMIEDALMSSSNLNMLGSVVAGINGAAGGECDK